MKSRIFSFLKIYLFWIFYFVFARVYFLFRNWSFTSEYSFGEILKAFIHGLKMDISMAGYFAILFAAIFTFTFWTGSRIVARIIDVFSKILISVTSLLLITNTEIYNHWGKHIDNSLLLYLKTPEEAASSLSIFTYILLIGGAGAITAGWIFIFNRYVKKSFSTISKSSYKTGLVFLVITVLTVIPIRGGLGIAPMNTGSVFFHKDIYPNNLAANYCWVTVNTLSKSKKHGYSYKFMEQTKADSLIASLYSHKSKSISFTEHPKPNIILIILESFTAKAIEPLGGLPDITPNLNQIAREGICFQNFYSSGARSDKGLVSILSGFPAQPNTSIMKYSQKTAQLPSLARELNQAGYSTAFTYGGSVDFANMRSYLMNSGFDEIISKDDYPKSESISKWGIPDDRMFEHFSDEITGTATPFFKTLYTLSSHEPFDYPNSENLGGLSVTEKFLNSLNYTDEALGNFFNDAKQQKWWGNTIIILTADHGHPLPGKNQINDKERYHIPLIITGGALNPDVSGNTIIGNHTDIPTTILASLNLPQDNFKYGKNLFSRDAPSFSFFVYRNAVGLIDSASTTTFQRENNSFAGTADIKISEKKKELMKAFLQSVWNDYNSY
jgi:phosphoglycerol transferase MdoB-like AlkP superfamily enzyme